ncbi:MAG: CHAP domain-containing protein [Clostridiales bacterium]|nr:CHAP domain-containing protein [Clostridiales bacterium]
MNRDYDESSRNDTLTKISSLKETIAGSSYSAPIDNTSVTGDLSWIWNMARNSADSASDSVNKVKEKIELLNTNLVRFYGHVDEVSFEIFRSAMHLSSTLSGALKSMEQLESLLNKSESVNDLTALSVLNVFEPLKNTRKVYAYETIMALVRPGGYEDKATRDAVTTMLHKNGIKDITTGDLSNFCLIYDHLIKNHDHEWIVDRLESIFTSHYFDDIALTGRYSSKDQVLCLEAFDAWLGNAEFTEDDRFRLLVKNLTDEHGALDPIVLGSFKEMLVAKNIAATDNQIRGYLNVISRMKTMGFSEDFIYNNTSAIFGYPSLAGIYAAGQHDGAGQTRLINEAVDKVVCDRLTQLHSNNTYNDDFIQAFKANTTSSKRLEFLFYLENADKSGYDRNDMLIELAKTTLGIMEHDGKHNFFNYEYAHYGKQTAEWCANYATWIISQCGFLDGSLVKDVGPDNVIDPNGPAWAAVQNMHEDLYDAGHYSVKEDYDPKNGDLIMFSEPDDTDERFKKNYYHVGLVVGVDPDNKIVYTIEGNSSGDGADDTKGVRLQAYKFDYFKIDGYAKMGGNEQNLDHIKYILNQSTAVKENPAVTEEPNEEEAPSE